MRDDDSERVEVKPTSRSSATVSDVVLRERDLVRLVFRPEIVNNPHDPTACVRGTFIYQKRGKNAQWQDFPVESLGKLKKGEGYQLELKTGEILKLLRELGALYNYHRKQGIPRHQVELVKLERRLVQLLSLSQRDLSTLLEANQADALKTISRALHWVASSAPLRELLRSEPERLPELTASLGVASLREAVGLWDEHKESTADEAFWQNALDKRAFLLAQLFHYPILVIRGKAYVGGKRLDNQHGNVADFLAKTRATSAALIVEIKTPLTPLLGSEYRQDVFPPSRDLGGSISQVLHYKSSLQSEINTIRGNCDEYLEADEPKCLVIAGNIQHELNSGAKRRAFERMRERLHGVTIIGFDELFQKASDLLNLLSDGAS